MTSIAQDSQKNKLIALNVKSVFLHLETDLQEQDEAIYVMFQLIRQPNQMYKQRVFRTPLVSDQSDLVFSNISVENINGILSISGLLSSSEPFCKSAPHILLRQEENLGYRLVLKLTLPRDIKHPSQLKSSDIPNYYDLNKSKNYKIFIPNSEKIVDKNCFGQDLEYKLPEVIEKEEEIRSEGGQSVDTYILSDSRSESDFSSVLNKHNTETELNTLSILQNKTKKPKAKRKGNTDELERRQQRRLSANEKKAKKFRKKMSLQLECSSPPLELLNSHEDDIEIFKENTNVTKTISSLISDQFWSVENLIRFFQIKQEENNKSKTNLKHISTMKNYLQALSKELSSINEKIYSRYQELHNKFLDKLTSDETEYDHDLPPQTDYFDP